MYLVLIAWLYVALMMAVAEATSPVGTLLGACVTFFLYGVLPMGIVGYIMGTPARRRAIRAQAAAEQEQALASPNADRETSSDPVSAVRKEP